MIAQFKQDYSPFRSNVFLKIDSLINQIDDKHSIVYFSNWDSSFVIKHVTGRAGIVGSTNVIDEFYTMTKEVINKITYFDQFIIDSVSDCQYFQGSINKPNNYYGKTVVWIESPIEGWYGLKSTKLINNEIHIPICISQLIDNVGVKITWHVLCFNLTEKNQVNFIRQINW